LERGKIKDTFVVVGFEKFLHGVREKERSSLPEGGIRVEPSLDCTEARKNTGGSERLSFKTGGKGNGRRSETPFRTAHRAQPEGSQNPEPEQLGAKQSVLETKERSRKTSFLSTGGTKIVVLVTLR